MLAITAAHIRCFKETQEGEGYPLKYSRSVHFAARAQHLIPSTKGVLGLAEGSFVTLQMLTKTALVPRKVFSAMTWHNLAKVTALGAVICYSLELFIHQKKIRKTFDDKKAKLGFWDSKKVAVVSQTTKTSVKLTAALLKVGKLFLHLAIPSPLIDALDVLTFSLRLCKVINKSIRK